MQIKFIRAEIAPGLLDELGRRPTEQAVARFTPAARVLLAAEASDCRYMTQDPRAYDTWSGAIGSSAMYYMLVRGNPRQSGPIQY